MSLEHERADVVRFECAKCQRSSSMRSISQAKAQCLKCGGDSWTLVTEYHEPNALGQYERRTVLPEILRALVEWMGWNRRQAYEGEVITLLTTDVPAAHVLSLLQIPFSRRGYVAHRYMQERRDAAAVAEREQLRERGGQECIVCGVFFMPHPDKPWTNAGCCTKACLVQAGGEIPVDFRESESAKPSKSLAVACACGHAFQVSPMYRGTQRPCPECGAMTVI